MTRMIFSCRGREAGSAETEKLSEKDKMLEEKEAEVCIAFHFHQGHCEEVVNTG